LLTSKEQPTMQSILTKYKIEGIWHFTDAVNLKSIISNGGLLSLAELERRSIAIAKPGGNQWSHDADKYKGVHQYVHMSFLDDHPMQFAAKQDGRITDPIWIKIDPSILLDENVRFSCDVSNKSGVSVLTAVEAIEKIDFEVLFTRTDWKDPAIQKRLRAAQKSEILIPTMVPLSKLIGKKVG
jgi:hypothetical protein